MKNRAEKALDTPQGNSTKKGLIRQGLDKDKLAQEN
jgi:hypothetical protein